MSNYTVDDIRVVENDIQRIQLKPTQNLSHLGQKGVNQLLYEIVNNAFDEYINEDNISDGKITIVFDKETCMISVIDNGRGIDRDALEQVCTKQQSGSKYYREGTSSSGEYGMGLTLVNAMSETFEITSTNYGYSRTIRFSMGVDKIYDNTVKVSDKKHGCSISFVPSPLLLKIEKNEISLDTFEEWINKLSYFLPKHIKIKLCIRDKNSQMNEKLIYNSKSGIEGYLRSYASSCDLLKTPIVLKARLNIMEDNIPYLQEDGSIINKSFERFIDLKVAMNYNTKSSDTIKYAFCNMIEQTEYGVHLDGALAALNSFIKSSAKEINNSKKPNVEITPNDILGGLAIVVYVDTNMSTNFTSQTKERLGNIDFYEPIKKMVSEQLIEYFKSSDNKKLLSRIIQNIQLTANSRINLQQLKKKKLNTKSGYLANSGIDKYTPANDVGKGDPLELFIVEGDSGGGGTAIGRFNNDLQGVFRIRGKLPNIHNKSSKQVESHDIWRVFFNDILKCGHDETFNIDNLVYDKICIMSDGDVDGDHIAALIIDGILMHAPKLIENGHLYRLKIPLYRFKGGYTELGERKEPKINVNLYKYSKHDFMVYFEDIISKKFKIKLNEKDDFLNRNKMLHFVYNNQEYYDEIKIISDFYGIPGEVVHYLGLCIFLGKNFDSISEFDKELSFDNFNNELIGIYNKKDYIKVIFTKDLYDRLTKLSDIIKDKNDGIYRYYLYEKTKNGNNLIGYLSIFEIMREFKKYEPTIEARFKGIGEFEPTELHYVAMKPDKRQLIRMTVSDAKHIISTLYDLFGKEATRDKRFKILSNLDFTLKDIDN